MRVFRILKIVDSTLDIQALVDRKGIKDLFLKNYCMRDKHLNPRTIQSYLTSLQHFYDFIKSENLAAHDKKIITSMESRVQTWKKGYTSKAKLADMAKMEHERRTRIKPEYILKFEASSAVVNTIGLLSSWKKIEITQGRFATIRDLIFTEVSIDNGHRAGVLANMTLEEYKNKEINKDGRFVITVFKHTKAKAGPIRISICEKIFGWMKIYEEKVRPANTSNTDNNSVMFVTWPYGEPFKNSGGKSNASTAMWKKGGMTRRVGANKFRKAAITASRQAKGSSDPFHDDLANLMGHQKKTADRYYFLDEKLESSERAAAGLPTIMGTVVRKDINPGTSGSNSQDEITNDAQMSDKVASRLNDENHLKSPARKKFTLFSDEVSQGKIAKSIVEKRIEDEPLLSALFPKRLQIAIIFLMKKSVPCFPKESEEFDSFSKTVSCCCS